MIERILPPAVRWSHSFDDRDDPLFPEELALLERAVEKRRAEFTTVRACARDALAALGHPPAPLLPGQRGAPVWPRGVVGSMTHCAGYRAAVVARGDEIALLGIDAEPHAALPEGVLDTIARPEERTSLDALPTTGGIAWDRLLFSAKESVYKAWFPVTRSWLDFDEASIVIAPDGTFTARILVPGFAPSGERLSGFHGRWLVDRGLVVTCIAMADIP
ncbi:4'-phosphopantetheinyl transferase superfamily protein [Streptomyces sp. NPDC051921]|uniref:4'-phosphopantetheinyl transferase family protein n=1 Tax=Streptomyces sp. NPDC051921 TaxID=3155806 RepID=UPI00341B8150